jgi:spore coat polysaccharide biosynthesis protein SpsF
MPKTIVIIQARMSSTRLPGKILLPLGNKSVLAHVVQRIKRCDIVDEVMVATTTFTADDATASECEKIGVKHFRGSSDNVLERYYLAAKMENADVVIRITSDCPFIDPDILTAMLNKFNTENPDYLSNTTTRTYPRGFDIEIFTFAALENAYKNAKADYEKEHVTPYIYLNPQKFTLSTYSDGFDNSGLRVTLDTEEDWEVIRQVYLGITKNNADFSYNDVVNYLRQNPDIAAINAEIEQKKLGE